MLIFTILQVPDHSGICFIYVLVSFMIIGVTIFIKVFKKVQKILLYSSLESYNKLVQNDWLKDMKWFCSFISWNFCFFFRYNWKRRQNTVLSFHNRVVVFVSFVYLFLITKQSKHKKKMITKLLNITKGKSLLTLQYSQVRWSGAGQACSFQSNWNVSTLYSR